MATAFTHAAAALGIASCFYRTEIPKRVWFTGAVCSALPDLDVIGFRFGIHYGDFWGHRGFTHSLVFAAILACITLLLLPNVIAIRRPALFAYLFLATASHGFLDAMTDGGLGVAFFSPFNSTRYFLPWRPIVVAPISITRFFSGRGGEVLKSEVVWVWIPATIIAVFVMVIRRRQHLLSRV